ncbi:copper resistance protein NlpE [Flavobacterium buctense]|uniref:Copper resistance protein NlpE n=1 Tax=Flavobacterium buctense TaxID=1648146 RepID=A0ABU9E2D8_9FLAO|nr:copper resistance protein NlpE [Flavobacterium buctense]
MKTIVSFLALLTLIGCKKEVEPTIDVDKAKVDTLTTPEPSIVKQDTIVATVDNSNTSLDWNGVYKGVTPCADCEGIETEITLNKNLTYKKTTKYLGKKDTQINTVEGKFVWNSDGINITLLGIKEAPSQYLVGENKLFQLDRSGKRITGNLASTYILIKTE